ncbi:hypothetical protein [Burkholderia cenocepacia]|uniref:hypothetical protein n=1 Tax=Burkholderia cenocepacia TaxID=95486 RepID=UPI002B2400DF|nr:hypothetical protein [Burkholderia cenocepacia]MEB2554066.1 hypothetical protein [Burkholderia cenocepacia]
MDEMMMKQMTHSQVQGSGCLGGNWGITQASALNQNNLPAEPTIRSMLEEAHQQVVVLEHEIVRLGEILHPVRSAVPCGVGQQKMDRGGEPECIQILRALVDRIAQQASIVRNISDEVRI